jgi:NAD(P)-dependent dehydrogenase (short-subunit alcohol dehydrogenase family)
VTDLGYGNKRVVVTGCTSGIGEATARLLLSLGAEVHGLDWKDCALPLASFTRLDLRDWAAIDAAAASLGAVDVLFNCAGVAIRPTPIEIMQINYIGPRRLTDALLPAMERGSAVISVASIGGLGWSGHLPQLLELAAQSGSEAATGWCEAHPDLLANAYGFSKEALIGWTLHASTGLAARGIRINCTLPGSVDTGLLDEFVAVSPPASIKASEQPMDRRSAPSEQASALVFLGSDWASYISGALLMVDGGFLAGNTNGQLRPANNSERR